MASKAITDLVKRAEDNGWTVTKTNGGHQKLVHPHAVRPVITSMTPSAYSTIANTEAELKRVLKQGRPDLYGSFGSKLTSAPKTKSKPSSRQIPNQNVFQMGYRLDPDQVVEAIEVLPSIDKRDRLLAWALAIVKMRLASTDWAAIQIIKNRFRQDDDFCRTSIENALPIGRDGLNFMRVRLRRQSILQPPPGLVHSRVAYTSFTPPPPEPKPVIVAANPAADALERERTIRQGIERDLHAAKQHIIDLRMRAGLAEQSRIAAETALAALQEHSNEQQQELDSYCSEIVRANETLAALRQKMKSKRAPKKTVEVEAVLKTAKAVKAKPVKASAASTASKPVKWWLRENEMRA